MPTVESGPLVTIGISLHVWRTLGWPPGACDNPILASDLAQYKPEDVEASSALSMTGSDRSYYAIGKVRSKVLREHSTCTRPQVFWSRLTAWAGSARFGFRGDVLQAKKRLLWMREYYMLQCRVALRNHMIKSGVCERRRQSMSKGVI
jgi:hypothetical protein